VTVVCDVGYELTFTNMAEKGQAYRPLCECLTDIALSLVFVKYQRETRTFCATVCGLEKSNHHYVCVCLWVQQRQDTSRVGHINTET
jgi:hypothetical protein